MKLLQTRRSMQHFYNELVYTEAALNASPYTAHLAGTCSELIDEWYDFAKKERVANQNVIRATAVLRVKDHVLDLAVREFAGVLLVQVNQNRDSTLYRRFFAIPPSKVIQQSVARQIETVESFFVPAIENLEEGHALKPYKDMMTQAASEADRASAMKVSAKASRKSMSLDMEEWKGKVNTLRMTTLGELLKIAGEQEYPRTWANRFYNTQRRINRKDETEETVAKDQVPTSTLMNVEEKSSPEAVAACA
ncbi:MAG: hypothetical protein GY847_25320 [Proteobacteria bacterium]|nr:hypothetical protein [Pseudomonadota bacterium]